MKPFMFEIELPGHLSPEFLALIPKQRAHIADQMHRGIIGSYALANDRSKLWVVIHAINKKEAEDRLNDMPLSTYFSARVIELAFHDSANFAIRPLILN